MKIKVPKIDDSELYVFKWLISIGSDVEAQQSIMLLESKIKQGLIHLCSPINGRLTKIIKDSGIVNTGDTVAEIEPNDMSDENADIQASNREEECVNNEEYVNNKDNKRNNNDNEITNEQANRNNNKENAMGQTGNPDKVIPILMPKAGQSVEEASLVKWNVKVGDEIREGQIIFEIETDKATIEVEATDSGKLAKIVVEEGDVVPVLTPVAYLADNEADVDAYLTCQGEKPIETPADSVQEQIDADDVSKDMKQDVTVSQGRDISISEDGRVKASPAAKKLAREKGIDLRDIKTASGPDGRIIIKDIELAVEAGIYSQSNLTDVEAGKAGGAMRRKLTPMRKAIAKNLTFSKQNVPHFYMKITIDASPMYEFYQSRRKQYKCSINDVIIAACGKAIMEFSAFRSRMENPDEVTEYSSVNIGIAVGLDNGLVVPVITGVENYDFEELANETRRIIKSARSGKPENMGKGVFTISNLGMYDVDEFSAIINPPEAAILAVGGMKENVIVAGGSLRIGKTISLTLSCDHRVIDGLLAAQFLGRLRQILENPEEHIK